MIQACPRRRVRVEQETPPEAILKDAATFRPNPTGCIYVLWYCRIYYYGRRVKN